MVSRHVPRPVFSIPWLAINTIFYLPALAPSPRYCRQLPQALQTIDRVLRDRLQQAKAPVAKALYSHEAQHTHTVQNTRGSLTISARPRAFICARSNGAKTANGERQALDEGCVSRKEPLFEEFRAARTQVYYRAWSARRAVSHLIKSSHMVRAQQGLLQSGDHTYIHTYHSSTYRSTTVVVL